MGNRSSKHKSRSFRLGHFPDSANAAHGQVTSACCQTLRADSKLQKCSVKQKCINCGLICSKRKARSVNSLQDEEGLNTEWHGMILQPHQSVSVYELGTCEKSLASDIGSVHLEASHTNQPHCTAQAHQEKTVFGDGIMDCCNYTVNIQHHETICQEDYKVVYQQSARQCFCLGCSSEGSRFCLKNHELDFQKETKCSKRSSLELQESSSNTLSYCVNKNRISTDSVLDSKIKSVEFQEINYDENIASALQSAPSAVFHEALRSSQTELKGRHKITAISTVGLETYVQSNGAEEKAMCSSEPCSVSSYGVLCLPETQVASDGFDSSFEACAIARVCASLVLDSEFEDSYSFTEQYVQDDRLFEDGEAFNDESIKKHTHQPDLARDLPEIGSKVGSGYFQMSSPLSDTPELSKIFHEIDAVEPLKKIASSPNTVASKLAAEALKVIGEKIPHRLSQQVPLWTVEDVAYWVSQIGFAEYMDAFSSSQVDGDLLLILNNEDLTEGLGMRSSIVRKRFMRELKSLKITSDYSASDPTGLDKWLMGLSPELSQYTYLMLRQGVDLYILKTLTDQELREECCISNSIHRRKILQQVGVAKIGDLSPDACPAPGMFLPTPMCPRFASLDFNCSNGSSFLPVRPIDVFICYRRSSGSQLASLLKVHLQLRGFSVFLDIDRLRAGKFDENLLHSIQMSQHFLLILTHDALDRCHEDAMQEDWVHKEIVAALGCNCNIIPIFDNFEWPPLEKLPEDMRGIVRFNCVRWVHEYQDACVDKLEKFLRRNQKPLSPEDALTPGQLRSSDSHLSMSDFSLRSHSSAHSVPHLLEDPFPTA